jgi:hypothetical protein
MKVKFMGGKNENAVEIIANGLPNGFHDASFYSFNVDFQKREAVLVFGLDISDANDGATSVINKTGRLLLGEVVFVIVEPPREVIEKGKEVICDLGALEGDELLKVFNGKLPTGAFANWVFLNETNSFIYFAAYSAKFEWAE